MGNITQYNKRVYDELWRHARFLPPEGMPWWSMARELSAGAASRLEIGPGVYPRLPMPGTHVVDLSGQALEVLGRHGAIVHRGLLHEIGFGEATFDLVGIFEVLEHVEDDEALLQEIARVIRPGGWLMASVPLGIRYHTAFDRFAGHVRRYEPAELRDKLAHAGFAIERFEVRPPNEGKLLGAIYAAFLSRFPRLGVRFMELLLVPLVRRTKLAWRPASEWEKRTRKAGNCAVVCRRL